MTRYCPNCGPVESDGLTCPHCTRRGGGGGRWLYDTAVLAELAGELEKLEPVLNVTAATGDGH